MQIRSRDLIRPKNTLSKDGNSFTHRNQILLLPDKSKEQQQRSALRHFLLFH